MVVLRDAQPDLALVLGAGALTLGAVAVGNLVSGDGLTLAWAAEAAMLSLLAYRFGDARLQPAALGYLGLATGHLLVVTEPVDELFQTSVEASTAIPTLAVAAAATAAGLLVRRRSRPISSAATLPSAPWGRTGLTLLVLGLTRRSSRLRYAGLALFGLTLGKIFTFDLAELSSVARAASFVAVGGLLLAGGVLVQRLSRPEVDILER